MVKTIRSIIKGQLVITIQVHSKAKEKRWALSFVLKDSVEGADLMWWGSLFHRLGPATAIQNLSLSWKQWNCAQSLAVWSIFVDTWASSFQNCVHNSHFCVYSMQKNCNTTFFFQQCHQTYSSITIVLPPSALDSDLTDMYLNENLQACHLNYVTNMFFSLVRSFPKPNQVVLLPKPNQVVSCEHGRLFWKDRVCT